MSVNFEAHGEVVLDGQTFAPGPHEDVKADKALLRLLNHAHAAGAVTLEGADPAAHGVQSQEDGERAYAEAVESGAWHEGNELAAAESEIGRSAALMQVDVGPAEEEEE